jgi:leucyl-tRNA synthetase
MRHLNVGQPVSSDYGEGAVMGVPGHDTRDMMFFKENVKHDSIPVVMAWNTHDCSLAIVAKDIRSHKDRKLPQQVGSFCIM